MFLDMDYCDKQENALYYGLLSKKINQNKEVREQSLPWTSMYAFMPHPKHFSLKKIIIQE